MNPLVVIGAVALIGFLATLGGAAADENGVTIINGNGGAVAGAVLSASIGNISID